MALATKCPHCNTTFRVAHDQLKLRGGIVRCGACNEVFDGNAALIEPLAKPQPAAVVLPPVPELPPPPPPDPTPFDEKMAALDTRAAEVLGGDSITPIYTLEIDTALATDQAEAEAEAEAVPVPDAGAMQHDEVIDVQPPSASSSPAPSPFPLPAEPATLPPAADEALDLDLDIEPEPAAHVEPLWDEAEPETATDLAAPAVAIEAEPLENVLDIEDMSDDGLEAALEAELAVMEHSISAQEGEPGLASEAGDRREPTFGELPVDEPSFGAAPAAIVETVPQDPDYDDPDQEALVQLSSAGMASSAQSARSFADLPAALPPAEDAADAVDPADGDAGDGEDEPGFVKRDRLRRKFGKAATIAMSLGSVLLVGALAYQGLTTFRNQIAAAMPPLKPALLAACNALGCKIELPAQIDDLTIEQGELQTLTETTFSFTTLLRNQSSTAQTWPHIELVLDDASDKHVLRRVFTPRDYLGPDVALAKGFAPHTEQSVKLYFELNQLKASGYHIAVFYP